MLKSLGAKPLVLPTPVWCVGTYDDAGKPNVMTVAWGGICCSKPPCVAISLRKATYTYGSLLARGAFTVSVPPERYAAEADYFGIASGRDTDKWAATGLTPARAQAVDAPYVAEFPMVLECTLVHHHDLGLHTYFVGEIQDVRVEETLLSPTGAPSVELLKPFTYAPGDGGYYGLGALLGKGFSIGKDLGK